MRLLSPVCLTLLALAACSGSSGDEAPDGAMQVRLVAAARASVPELKEAFGTVASTPQGIADLTSPGASRVLAVRVGVGDPVRAGQVLITLDPSVWDAELADTEAAAATARQALERANRLVEQGIVPRRDAEQASADLARAEAALAAARRTRDLADVRSPIDGLVERLDAILDQIVTEGTVLIRVIDPRAIEIVFQVAPQAASRLEPGMPIALVAGSGRALGAARVLAIAPGVDATSGSVRIRASITRTERVLRPGEVVSGLIELDRHEEAIVVPVGALVDEEGDTAVVFVAGEDGLAHARSVRLGARAGGNVEVISGLAEGERVIAESAWAVRDSARITPRASS